MTTYPYYTILLILLGFSHSSLTFPRYAGMPKLPRTFWQPLILLMGSH